MTRRWILALIAAGMVFFWGASFPLTKVALQWLGPTSIAFLRWTISAVILIGWLAVCSARGVAAPGRRGLTTTVGTAVAPVYPLAGPADKLAELMRLVRRDGWLLAWVALTGVTLFYFLENLALRYTTAINAGVLSNLTSIFIVLVSMIWLRERLALIEWAAMGIAFLGATLVSQGAGHFSWSGPGLVGDLMMVLASFFGGIYSVGGKRLVADYPADVVTTGVATLGALFLAPLALLEGLSLVMPLSAWGALLLLGVGAGALANLWWLRLLSHTSAGRAGAVLFLIPIVATALAVVGLREPLTPVMVLGGLLVLAGVAVMRRGV